jgi:hypothetical protein
MVKDKELAKHLLYIAHRCLGMLDNSVALSMRYCTEEESLKYKMAVGRVMGELLCEIMDPMVWEYPDLDPLRPSTDANPQGPLTATPPPAEAASAPEARDEPAPDDRSA